jgi:hypothetical protein
MEKQSICTDPNGHNNKRKLRNIALFVASRNGNEASVTDSQQPQFVIKR